MSDYDETRDSEQFDTLAVENRYVRGSTDLLVLNKEGFLEIEKFRANFMPPGLLE